MLIFYIEMPARKKQERTQQGAKPETTPSQASRNKEGCWVLASEDSSHWTKRFGQKFRFWFHLEEWMGLREFIRNHF